MPLVNLKTILADAWEKGYAVGGFNFNGFEDTKGLFKGAAEKNSPLIVMASTGTIKYMGVHTVYGMVAGLAKDYSIPATLHLDHCTDVDLALDCVRAGFTSVMIDASARDYEQNILLSKTVADFAHGYDCSVEAELGVIGGKEDNVSANAVIYTDPADVPRFVRETGVDALAVAVGTIHGFYKSAPKIDFDRIAAIKAIAGVPLVLHGGTGLSLDDFKRAIACGMTKINVGTEFKQAFCDMLRQSVADNPNASDSRKLLPPVIEKCAEIARGKIDIFGSAGKARV